MTEDKEDNQIKDHVLRDIYYNQDTGFQNQQRTYKAAKKGYQTSHRNMYVSGLVSKRVSNLSHTGGLILTSWINHPKRLLLIWLISAVMLSIIGVTVIFLSLWTHLRNSHGPYL